MLLKNFNEKYTSIVSNLISEQNSQLPGESKEDFEERMRYRERDQWEKRHEQEPENHPDPAEVEAKRHEAIKQDNKELKDFNDKVKNLPKMSTKELEGIITTFDDNDKTGMLTSYKIKAAQELMKRSDVDTKFLEDVIFNTDPNYISMGTVKQILFTSAKNPKDKIIAKVKNGEYPLEKLKTFIKTMEDKANYNLFDSNSGQNSWVDMLVSAMRISRKYFTGQWPNEEWAK